MNSKFRWAASWVIGTCVFAACGGTPLLPNTTGGTVGGPILGVPTPQPLPNMAVTSIALDQSITGSVFAPNTSAKTAYVRLKVQLSNNGGSPASPGKITIRTFQQYGVITYTTTYPVSGVISAGGSTTVSVLAPLERIAKGWETGFVFEVTVDPSNSTSESNENDNVSMGCGYYGWDVLGQYLSQFQKVIGRGVEPLPKPKPIRDPGFFIPHTVQLSQPGFVSR